VVTPNPFHYRVAAEAVDLGASRLVIEKPLAHKLSEAKAFLKLKCQICVLENYLFSDVTNYLRETIHADGLRPQFVKSEFSKDRRVDSANGRGSAHGTLPHVFTVELPHQVAVVGHVLGSIGKVTDAWHHDMILPDGRIADHGEGAITLMHDDSVPSYNFSCLQGFRHTSACYRSLKVYCADDVNVFGFYSTTVDLDGSVLVYRRNRLLKRKLLKDDSLKNGLRDSLDCLRFKRESLASLKFGIDVLRVIEAGQRVAKRTP
jgi:predicted dehydrogenase